MAKAQYGIVELKTELPIRKLLIVPHKGRSLIVSYPAFGLNTYANNLAEMQKKYSHNSEHFHLNEFSFSEPTTSESISAAAFEFEKLAKPEIFDTRWLQAGYIVRTSEGVFTNTEETNESALKKMLNGIKKVNGIYLIDENVAFAPYETFKRRKQDLRDFAEGGLARALEHTEESSAKSLEEISSRKFYKKGVDVWGFDSVKEPVLRVVGLDSGRGIDSDWLVVIGDYWDDGDGGCSFGVLRNN